MSSLPVPKQTLGSRTTKSKLPMMSRLPTTGTRLAQPAPRPRGALPSARAAPAVSRKRKSDCFSAAPVKKVRRENAAPAAVTKPRARPAVARPTKQATQPSARVQQLSAVTGRAKSTAVNKRTGASTRKPLAGMTQAAAPNKQTAKKPAKKPAGTKTSRPGWDLRGQIAEMKEALLDKENQLSVLTETSDQREQLLAEYQSQAEELEAKLGDARGRLQQKTADCAAHLRRVVDLESDLAEAKATIETQLAKIADLEKDLEERARRLIEAEENRKMLHNQVQELKGNIRVFCRVRPLLQDEQESGAHEIVAVNDEKTMELTNLKDRSLNKTSKKLEFGFDHIFGPESSQSDVFAEISQLVQSALDGYNVCIFAYGQTGSGKTFTMEGPVDAGECHVGMIPRSVSQVFTASLALQDKGWDFEMEATFLEIYNDTICDLLGNGSTKKPEVRMVGARSKEVEVTNIVRHRVTSEGQVAELLTRAAKNRAVASTAYNERSSRSHSIFRLRISGTNRVTGASSQGTLNLVDLAGSERCPDSGYDKERMTEMKKINQSLSNLGNVIMALAAKESHVPFRNCKLTHLLQDSLGGNSKTLMFVNVSPKEDLFHETLSSLRFAVKVNSCNIGTAQKRVK